jgi:Flp pilus assembly protein TadG
MSLLRLPLPRWPLLRRFARAERGVAAIEFAFILPVMLTMYIGGLTVGQAIAVDRKVTLLARTLGDLTAQFNVVTDADMSNIFDAAATIMTPYPSAGARMVVTSVWTDDAGATKVDWSVGRNASAMTSGTAVTLPAGLASRNSSVVMARVDYTYNPPLVNEVFGELALGETIYVKPRGTERILRE